MSRIADHFVFLAAEARQLSGTRLLSRPVGRVPGGQILASLDADGFRHLLIPISDEAIADDQGSQGVTLESRVLRVGEADVTFVDLQCRMPRLDMVFERLLEDVLARLSEDGTRPIETCRQVLDEWRALLRTAADDIARDTILGLVGELEVLRLIASRAPSAAVDAWLGPTGSVHDFVHGAAEIEVKTTASVAGNTITVSNLDQLDATLLPDKLHLVVVHARPDETALTLDQRIDELAAIGVPRNELIQKVGQAGYVYESPPGVQVRYAIRSVRAWHVDQQFPGLRASDIGESRLRGVDRVSYELNLDVAPARLSDPEFEALVETWIGAT